VNARIGCVLVVIVLIASVSPVRALEFRFKGNEAVGLCCLESGTDALFFGLVWQERPWVSRTTVVREIETTPSNGKTAWYEPEVGAPESSCWIGVDLSSGIFTTVSRTKRQLEEKTIPPENLARDGQRSIVAVDVEAGYLEVVVVRPGEAAWAFTGGDGSTFDGDGRSDGWVRAEIWNFRPVDGGPEAPKVFSKGDVILALDTTRGVLSTVVIDG